MERDEAASFAILPISHHKIVKIFPLCGVQYCATSAINYLQNVFCRKMGHMAGGVRC
jgi:hypothetical protein